MKFICYVLVFFSFSIPISAQNIISGTVSDAQGTPLMGANIFLEGTYDGASSDVEGKFSFETSEVGVQTLVISFISFESQRMTAAVQSMKNLAIVLREDLNSLDAVTLSAGTFTAGENSKASVLKPLDIVTTASAVGDFIGALQTLPGTTTVAEDGRLFVRGGEASETQIFIDGIRVFTPYTPSANNVPTRGRYSPFLFDGITFSTGGYAAEYGQALSSVLLLNTINEPAEEKTDIAIMSVGVGLGHTLKGEKNSLSVNGSYFNLAPYLAIMPDRNNWEKPVEMASGEAVYRHKIGDGLLKFYAAFDNSEFELTQEDVNYKNGLHFKLKDQNFYSNLSYKEILNRGWTLFAGGSYTYARTRVGIDVMDIDDKENAVHLKLKMHKRFSNRFKMDFGAEQLVFDFNEDYKGPKLLANLGFQEKISAVFSEADVTFSKNMALQVGLRSEYGSLSSSYSISPRLAFAYRLAKNNQVSIAYGDFYQRADKELLKLDSDLKMQHAQHYLLNYQYTGDRKIFRAEIYHKVYDRLVSYSDSIPLVSSQFTNDGYGYAQGIDLFWRDNETVRNFEYWISYSYLDSKRKYKDFPDRTTPGFVNNHNLSVVGKYWIESLRSQVGFSYQFASGRRYTDFNSPGFLQAKTKSYNSVSLNWAYLIAAQKILYASLNNVFAFKNINGYQYANTPDVNGFYDRRALRPAADQFFMVGFFWTISTDKTQNQLKNL